MDPVNLILAINLFVTMTANWGGAQKGLKTSITKVVERPETYLQKLPPNIAAVVLILTILGIFKIGTLSGSPIKEIEIIRYCGLGLFIVFSWIQVLAYKTLGSNYAQDIVILKEHKLVRKGIYRVVRHPQYISQLLSDLGAGLALMSYLVLPIVLLVEIPLFIARAFKEEKMMAKHFKDEFVEYKKKSGFIFPFIG